MPCLSNQSKNSLGTKRYLCINMFICFLHSTRLIVTEFLGFIENLDLSLGLMHEIIRERQLTILSSLQKYEMLSA